MASDDYICRNCGTQYDATENPPNNCLICEDERENVKEGGQQWTTTREMLDQYSNKLTAVEPNVVGIITEPEFAIGQEVYVIQTANGNILWDCLSYLDDTSIANIRRLGGLAAIAVSHPHLHGNMIDWSRAFDNAPIYLHETSRSWVTQDLNNIRFWRGVSKELLPGVTMIRCGGHFEGSCVLHWKDSKMGGGVIFTSDTIQPLENRRWASFMYSYPNLLPMSANSVRKILAAIEPYAFDRMYGGRFYGGKDNPRILQNAKSVIWRSAERYIKHIED